MYRLVGSVNHQRPHCVRLSVWFGTVFLHGGLSYGQGRRASFGKRGVIVGYLDVYHGSQHIY